jgi:four helix bundle protein
LIRQIRRAAVSILTNIAEGCGRGTDAELAQFCQVNEVKRMLIKLAQKTSPQSLEICQVLKLKAYRLQLNAYRSKLSSQNIRRKT